MMRRKGQGRAEGRRKQFGSAFPPPPPPPPFLPRVGASALLASRINNEVEKGGEEAHDTEK